MTKFKDIIFRPNVAIHCPEEWMADSLLRFARNKGYKWSDGSEYNESFYDIFGNKTCYILYDGFYMTLDGLSYEFHTILNYYDVVIKEGEEMETKLDYELVIKGRRADIGSELWLYNGDEELKEVTVSKISIFNFQDPQIRLKDKNNKYYFFRIDDLGFIDKCLFWEKPIIYQLPDTEGNLSEVKVGQHVWVKYEGGNVYKGVIYEFNGSDIEIMFISDNGKIFASNKEGMTPSGGVVSTNKPIIYQLPDIEGNLSEVKIGQKVYTKYDTNGKIVKLFDGNIYVDLELDERIIVTYDSITGENAFHPPITTNKPSRFHNKQDWSQAPEKAMCWAIDDGGDAYWYTEKPITNQCFWDSNSFSNSSKDAGYRNDLIDDRENMEVTDWHESLVMRPKGK